MAMFAAYYVSWVLSPLDTQWLVTTSADRLIAQLWPSLVIAAFSCGPQDEWAAFRASEGFAPVTARSDN
jgi:hypothetical protein